MNILVVDDEEAIADFISECIELIDSNINVDVFYSGEEAFGLLDRSKYDLIFSDYMMPEVGGKEILEKANTLSGTPPAFCIVTGHSKEIGKNLNYRGSLLLLGKPFQFADIEGIVNKFCLSVA